MSIKIMLSFPLSQINAINPKHKEECITYVRRQFLWTVHYSHNTYSVNQIERLWSYSKPPLSFRNFIRRVIQSLRKSICKMGISFAPQRVINIFRQPSKGRFAGPKTLVHDPRGNKIQLPVRNHRVDDPAKRNRTAGVFSPPYPGTLGLNDIIRTLRLSPRKYVILARAKSRQFPQVVAARRGGIAPLAVKSLSD